MPACRNNVKWSRLVQTLKKYHDCFSYMATKDVSFSVLIRWADAAVLLKLLRTTYKLLSFLQSYSQADNHLFSSLHYLTVSFSSLFG